jgi:hypothetical protein
LLGSLLVLGSASSASAALITTGGFAAPVHVNGTLLMAAETDTKSASGQDVVTMSIDSGGLTVGASAVTSEDQTVAVDYFLQQRDGLMWTTVQTKTFHGTVSGSGLVSFVPASFVAPLGQPHLYRVRYDIYWVDPDTGQTLTRGNVQATDGDSVCTTPHRMFCEATNGMLRL